MLSWFEGIETGDPTVTANQMCENYCLAAHAPHLALHAPHFCIELFVPHLLPLQARHIMEQPPRAAVVTTAIASAFARVEDIEFMVMLLKVLYRRMAYCLTAAHAPHLAFIFLALWALLAAH